uniref:Uncharacterized protein n=1 Tax=Octopus bimaculoides TaxID=37653 RepID=A0A0L8HS73_OCTBM
MCTWAAVHSSSIIGSFLFDSRCNAVVSVQMSDSGLCTCVTNCIRDCVYIYIYEILCIVCMCVYAFMFENQVKYEGKERY